MSAQLKSRDESLADVLDAVDPRPDDEIPITEKSEFEQLADIKDAVTFCQRVMQTREFRQYIMNGIVLGDLPPAIMCRVIDHAWGKPPERVEHTGKDGAPIVTEIRRIIVRAPATPTYDEPVDTHKPLTH